MSKAVLISIKPQWCELIANGQKTVEVRKSRPKLETPFKCYIYCTVPKMSGDIFHVGGKNPRLGNSKVIGEFVCENIECFTTDYRADIKQTKRISEQSCLSPFKLEDYEGDSHCLYGWHISDLKIYDEPKELTEFNHTDEYIVNLRKSLPHWEYGIDDECAKPIRNPPQSWCYVEEVRE